MQTNARVLGSGYTSLTWQGQIIAFLEQFDDTAPKPVGGAGGKAIQPLDAPHPVEIVTPKAITEGTLKITVTELWNAKAWQRLAGMEGANNIQDIFAIQSAMGTPISCTKLIKPPTGPTRGTVYHGCTITDVNDNETVQIGTLNVPKDITIMYTHRTYV